MLSHHALYLHTCFVSYTMDKITMKRSFMDMTDVAVASYFGSLLSFIHFLCFGFTLFLVKCLQHTLASYILL